jgi:hypothetical protein
MRIWTISGSFGLGWTWIPASKPSFFRKWRLTAAGMTWRSVAWTPVELTPAISARLTRRLEADAARLVTSLSPRFNAVPSASPRRSAVSGVRSTSILPTTPSIPIRREESRDSQIRFRSTSDPDSTSLNG